MVEENVPVTLGCYLYRICCHIVILFKFVILHYVFCAIET